jgi:uncharacterized protein (TIGR03083 family)
VEIAEHIDVLSRQGQLMAVAAAAAGLDAAVPSCPEWVVRDLVQHQGGVHRWATSIVSVPRTELWDVDLIDVVGSWPADADLIDWFTDGAAALVQALSNADPDLACWTFLAAPSPLAMWARRQAHETTIHRVDAELAAALPVTSPPGLFAADGIDELLRCFTTRPYVKLRSDPPVTLRVRCTDRADSWLVQIGPERVRASTGEDALDDSATADCTVSGRAEDLYLGLWNRLPATLGQPASRLAVEGDPAIVDLFTGRVQIRWS